MTSATETSNVKRGKLHKQATQIMVGALEE